LRALGKIAQIGLILLFEKSVLVSEPFGGWLKVPGKDRTGYNQYEKQTKGNTHNLCRVSEDE
jgi:hypothetical protein